MTTEQTRAEALLEGSVARSIEARARMREELAAAIDAVAATLPLSVKSVDSAFKTGRAIGRLEAMAATCRAHHVHLPDELAERLSTIWAGVIEASDKVIAEVTAHRTPGGIN